MCSTNTSKTNVCVGVRELGRAAQLLTLIPRDLFLDDGSISLSLPHFIMTCSFVAQSSVCVLVYTWKGQFQSFCPYGYINDTNTFSVAKFISITV